jgi:hypothetical protein
MFAARKIDHGAVFSYANAVQITRTSIQRQTAADGRGRAAEAAWARPETGAHAALEAWRSKLMGTD